MENVRSYFEQESDSFDEDIHFIVPNYEEMLDALFIGFSFDKSLPINVVDVGCGTGSVTQRLKQHYPHAFVTCLDISERMLNIARSRLSSETNIHYQLADFEEYEMDNSYDVVISSLALHHSNSDEAKIRFYEKVLKALVPGGFFYNADIVLGSSL